MIKNCQLGSLNLAKNSLMQHRWNIISEGEALWVYIIRISAIKEIFIHKKKETVLLGFLECQEWKKNKKWELSGEFATLFFSSYPKNVKNGWKQK